MPGLTPTHPRIVLWFGIPLFLIVIIVGGSALIWEVRTIAGLENQIASLARENGQLLRRIDDLTSAQPSAGPVTESAKTFAEMPKTISDLEDNFRQREIYLNNILRRYREINQQYRTLPGASGPLNSAGLARIQDSLHAADEELKKITALDAEAERLQKKLPAK